MSALGPDPPIRDPEMMARWLADRGHPPLVDRAGRLWQWTSEMWRDQVDGCYAHRHRRWGTADLVSDFAPVVVVKDQRLLQADLRMEPVAIRDVRTGDHVVLDDGLLAEVVAQVCEPIPCGHRYAIRNQYGRVARRGETMPVLRVRRLAEC